MEASRIIPDLDTRRLLSAAQKKYEEKRRRFPAKKPTFFWLQQPVYEFGDGEKQSYVFLVEDGRVIYFVQYKRISHNNFRLGRQVLLVRDRRASTADGFARHIFFNVLLPRYTALVADQLQSRFGKAFWGNALRTAWDKNLYTYVLDRRARKTRLLEFSSESDFQLLGPEIWGTSKAHELIFPVISTKPLKLKG